MKNLLIIVYMLVAANVYGAAGSFNDLYHIGKVGSGVNVELEIGDKGSFRYNFGTSTMELTHDGINYSPIASSDHTLIDTAILQNKTLDNTNKIDSQSYNEIIEIGPDNIITGDRAARIDFHRSDGVDYSSRIISGAGVNGAWDFIQTGTGQTRIFAGSGGVLFYDENADIVMSYSNRGSLVINNRSDGTIGGIIRLTKGSAASYNSYIDNDTNQFRIHNGSSVWLTQHMQTGATILKDTGGHGGNVPHNCTVRSASSSDGFGSVSVSCSAGEAALGGGCYWTSGTDPTWSVPNPTTGLPTGWFCEQSNGGFLRTAYAVCCDY